jgi:hypothetical protein
MDTCFRIEMLPAHQGDCLWIEYGDPEQPHRVLVDGGTPETYGEIKSRVLKLPQEQRQFELLIVTHVDSDHIGGTLDLLAKPEAGRSFRDVWFNGWAHLAESKLEDFGPVQGERLSKTLLGMADVPWNLHFLRHAVRVPDSGPLPVRKVEGGLTLTLLSPGADQLLALKPVWEAACTAAHLNPAKAPEPLPAPPPGFEAFGPPDVEAEANAPFVADTSEANGSSIAVLAEFEGRRILLAGDAHADVLEAGIARLVAPGERLHLDAFKLPHHGSKANTSRELLDKVDCGRYLFSTDGEQFRHPDEVTVARVIKFGGSAPELIFNYQTKFNLPWSDHTLKDQYGYCVSYPPAGQKIDL